MKIRRTNRSPFSRASQPKSKHDELFLYDEIGYYGISAENFIRDLNSIEGNEALVRINSPGGEVFEGVAMYHALKDFPGKVTTQIDGIAASIASVIALGAKEVHITESAYFMIHQVSSFVWGTATDFRKEANLLDKLDATIVNIYAKRMNLSDDEIKSLMVDETWFNADEALEIGLADKIIDGGEVSAKFDLGIYNNVPNELLTGKPAPKDIERALRDVGLTQKEAKAFIAEGKTALNRRDVGDDSLKNSMDSLIQSLTKETETIKCLN